MRRRKRTLDGRHRVRLALTAIALGLLLGCATGGPGGTAQPAGPADPASGVGEGTHMFDGLFRYEADAALFEGCDGARLPVIQDGRYLALERAYLKRMHGSGEPVGVTIEGRYVPYSGEGPFTHAVFVEAFEFWPAGGGCTHGQAEDP